MPRPPRPSEQGEGVQSYDLHIRCAIRCCGRGNANGRPAMQKKSATPFKACWFYQSRGLTSGWGSGRVGIKVQSTAVELTWYHRPFIGQIPTPLLFQDVLFVNKTHAFYLFVLRYTICFSYCVFYLLFLFLFVMRSSSASRVIGACPVTTDSVVDMS